jgi:hypothetical protein
VLDNGVKPHWEISSRSRVSFASSQIQVDMGIDKTRKYDGFFQINVGLTIRPRFDGKYAVVADREAASFNGRPGYRQNPASPNRSLLGILGSHLKSRFFFSFQLTWDRYSISGL